MSGRKIRNAGDARDCLEAVQESGMARAVWARANGVDARSLNAWRLNLERGGREKPEELRVVELVPEVRMSSVFRVACGPFVVEVPPDFDQRALCRLLDAVASC